jgi:hypothetical protein
MAEISVALVLLLRLDFACGESTTLTLAEGSEEWV